MMIIKNNLDDVLKKMNFIHITCFLLFLPIACSSGDAAPNTAVTNLTVEVTLVGADDQNPNGDGSGVVKVTATANNATRYAFRFDNGDLQDSSSGTMEHVFSEVGTNTYNIVAWAYSDTGDFVNETVNITVFKSDELFTKLVFFDEFENEGSPDAEKWHHQVIPVDNGSWANGELQHYTDRIQNSVVSDGTLKINSIKEQFTTGGTTKEYTSARLNSKFVFTYGRVEVRAKLAKEQGTWPAIWTLGANIDEIGNYFGDQYGSVGWPACGEIDILEQTGWDKNTVISHFHWGDRNTNEYKNEGCTTAISNASSEFHIYSMEWTSDGIKTFLDDKLIYELPNSSDKPYDHPHYLLLNLAMGGNLGGEVGADFMEDTFEIDYVRIYQ